MEELASSIPLFPHIEMPVIPDKGKDLNTALKMVDKLGLLFFFSNICRKIIHESQHAEIEFVSANEILQRFTHRLMRRTVIALVKVCQCWMVFRLDSPESMISLIRSVQGLS